MKLAKT